MTTGRIVIVGLVVAVVAVGVWIWLGRTEGSGGTAAGGLDFGTRGAVAGQPPLHAAAQQGDVDAVRRLLGEGADVDGRDQHGITALHRAVGMGQTAVVKALLEAGADVNAEEPGGGRRPLHAAAVRGQAEAAALLLKAGAEVNAKTKDGATPLDLAVERGNAMVADVLRGHGGEEARK